MTPTEARSYVTWFRNNHLPKDAYFVQTSAKRKIMLDSMDDEEAMFVANQFEAMLDVAMQNREDKRK